MERVSPPGPVYQAGTLSGSPLGMAAGAATLRFCGEKGFHESLAEKARGLTEGLAQAAAAAGVPLQARAEGGTPGMAFHHGPVRAFLARNGFRLALVATPGDVAQTVCDRLVAAGITAIWNYAPVRLTVPEGVCVRDEHISLGLAPIAYHLSD